MTLGGFLLPLAQQGPWLPWGGTLDGSVQEAWMLLTDAASRLVNSTAHCHDAFDQGPATSWGRSGQPFSYRLPLTLSPGIILSSFHTTQTPGLTESLLFKYTIYLLFYFLVPSLSLSSKSWEAAHRPSLPSPQLPQNA